MSSRKSTAVANMHHFCALLNWCGNKQFVSLFGVSKPLSKTSSVESYTDDFQRSRCQRRTLLGCWTSL